MWGEGGWLVNTYLCDQILPGMERLIELRPKSYGGTAAATTFASRSSFLAS